MDLYLGGLPLWMRSFASKAIKAEWPLDFVQGWCGYFFLGCLLNLYVTLKSQYEGRAVA